METLLVELLQLFIKLGVILDELKEKKVDTLDISNDSDWND